MTRSKKIFAGFVAIFILLLIYVVVDISSRTTFPGRPKDDAPADSIPIDTAKNGSNEAPF